MNTIRSIKFSVCIIFAALVLSSSAQIITDSTEVLKTSIHVGMKKKAIKAIAKSIFKSKYKDWKVIDAQKEIFKDSETNTLVAYKITVVNDADTNYLFYKTDGILILDKQAQP